MTDILPKHFSAGTTLRVTATLTAYPAPDWSLSVILRGAGTIDLQATADGNAHLIEVDAATTQSWAAGSYWYSVRVTDGTDTFEVESGTIQIAADLLSATADYDGRSHVKRMLDAIEAVMEKRATLDQERYRINNRELYRTPMAELIKLRDKYRNEYAREKQAKQGRFGRKHLVRF